MAANQPSAPIGDIADRIRNARSKRGWTQADLAENSDLSRPTIARVERGDDVSTATLAKVAAALGLRISVTEEPGTPTDDEEASAP